MITERTVVGSAARLFTSRIGALALCFALAVPATLDAQVGSDVVPSDVVRTILRHVDSRSTILDIHVEAQPPDTLASRVSLPPGARHVASLTGDPSYIIGVAAGDPDSIRLWFAEEFERRGYQPADWVGQPPPFRPAERSPSNSGYCDAGTHFGLTTRRQGRDSIEFVIRLQQSRECRPAAQHAVASMMMVGYGYSTASMSGDGPAELPLLRHPRSAEVTLECTRAGLFRERMASAQGRLSTTASAATVVAHYGRQLDSLGWHPDTLFTGAIEGWTKRDSAGTDLRLVLSFRAVAGERDCRAVEMTVQELRP